MLRMMRQELVSILLGEVPQEVRGDVFPPSMNKSAPAYVTRTVPKQEVVGQEAATVDGQEVVFELRGYPPDILLIRAVLEIENIFDRETISLGQKLFQYSRGILNSYGGDLAFSEDYNVFVVSGYEGEPEQFLVHAPVIASLLKSERLELAEREVEYTLRSQIKYAKDDLAIVDWDGTILFDAEGDTEEDLELLTLANLQLLRHRILDRQLDERLAEIGGRVDKPFGRMSLSRREIAEDLRAIVRDRTASISELKRLERDIKMIGDWYSARFYELARGKFKIEEWHRSIRGKLESLEDIYSIVVENFTVSAKHRAEWVQIILFFVLQVGWFVLIILEFFYFTRH